MQRQMWITNQNIARAFDDGLLQRPVRFDLRFRRTVFDKEVTNRSDLGSISLSK